MGGGEQGGNGGDPIGRGGKSDILSKHDSRVLSEPDRFTSSANKGLSSFG